MRYVLLVIIAVCTSSFAKAEAGKAMGLDDIMDAYLVAKADVKGAHVEPTNVAENPYTIQVAAYLSEQDALKHVAELKKKQKDTYYFSSFARGQVWYKVCVGRFDNIKKAENFRKKFVKEMEEPFAVVITLKANDAKRGTASIAKAEAPQKKTAKKLEPAPVKVKKEISKLPSGPKPAVKTPKKDMKVAMLKKGEAAKTMGAQGTKAVKEYLYSLQVGSFAKEAEAQTKAKSLQVGTEAYVSSAEVNGKTWYRVFVGKFNSKDDAKGFQTTYREKTKDNAAFIKRVAK